MKYRQSGGRTITGPADWFTGLSLAHILSHSAGYGGAEAVSTTAASLGIPLEDLTYKQVHVNFLATVPIQHEPGTSAPYNNHHLGGAIDVVSWSAAHVTPGTAWSLDAEILDLPIGAKRHVDASA